MNVKQPKMRCLIRSDMMQQQWDRVISMNQCTLSLFYNTMNYIQGPKLSCELDFVFVAFWSCNIFVLKHICFIHNNSNEAPKTVDSGKILLVSHLNHSVHMIETPTHPTSYSQQIFFTHMKSVSTPSTVEWSYGCQHTTLNCLRTLVL